MVTDKNKYNSYLLNIYTLETDSTNVQQLHLEKSNICKYLIRTVYFLYTENSSFIASIV